MVIDYWERVFRGEEDPLRGVMRRFRISGMDAVMFYSRMQIYEMDETRH